MTRLVLVLLMALLPTVAQAQDILPITVPTAATVHTPPPSLNLELSIFTLLQAADVVTTRHILSRGGYEANPIMRPFAGSTVKLALVKGGLVAFGAVVTKAAAREGKGREARVMLWILNGVMVGVVAHNVWQIGRAR